MWAHNQRFQCLTFVNQQYLASKAFLLRETVQWGGGTPRDLIQTGRVAKIKETLKEAQ